MDTEMGVGAPLNHGPSLDAVLSDVLVWRRQTFPRSTVDSTIRHLKREVQELAEHPSDPHELADVAMLLAGLADMQGIDLAAAVASKLEINRPRNWGEPDAEGVVEHLREVVS